MLHAQCQLEKQYSRVGQSMLYGPAKHAPLLNPRLIRLLRRFRRSSKTITPSMLGVSSRLRLPAIEMLLSDTTHPDVVNEYEDKKHSAVVSTRYLATTGPEPALFGRSKSWVVIYANHRLDRIEADWEKNCKYFMYISLSIGLLYGINSSIDLQRLYIRIPPH
jgi:hypothetical protein